MQPINVLIFSGATLDAAVPAGSYSKTDIATATCSISFLTNGNYTVVDDLGSSGVWKTGGGLPSAYEIRWTNTSGTLSSGGPAGSWLSLGSNQGFVVERLSPGGKTCTGTVEIRRASDGVVLDSGSITITATATP